MCVYQCDKAVTKNDTREVILSTYYVINELLHVNSLISFLFTRFCSYFSS